MEITRGYKVKIYPSKSQEQKLLRQTGACRFVYNYFLDRKKSEYLSTGKNLTYNQLAKELTKLRKEFDWLGEVGSVPLQQSLRCLDVAYNRFFRKQAKFPRFKKKNGKQTMRKVMGWSIEGNRIKIARGLSVRFRGNFPTRRSGTLTISRDAVGDWYASTIATVKRKQPKLRGSIGIDLGLNHLAITSDGEKFENPRVLSRLLKRIQSASKAFSRTKKGSRARAKKRLALARTHRKVERVRENGLHHVSKAIVSKNHAMIAVEDLSVKNMMKNRRLSRTIADTSWGEFLRQLTYKQEWNGGKIVKIDRFFPSSKTCSNCNFVIDKLPLSVRDWECPKCETKHDRDINAAKMVLKQAGEQLEVEGKALALKVRTKLAPKKLGYVQR